LKKLSVFLVLSILSLGCQARSIFVRPVLETEGELFVYLEELPPETAPLVFRLEEISAMREDGTILPLSISRAEVRREGVQKHRLIASGAIPPGRYIGLSFTVKDASWKEEGGETVLQIPKEPARAEIIFTVNRKRGTVLSLSLRFRDSVTGGGQFLPVFNAVVPGKISTGLNGFASNRSTNTITIFDKVSGEVVGIVPTGAGPAGMVLDQGKRRTYVALSREDAVEVIDVLKGEIIDRLRLRAGDNPIELALAPDGGKLLSVNAGSNTVSVIDPVALIEEVRIPVGNGPRSLVVDRTGRRAYVINSLSDSISILDIPLRRVAATIRTEASPLRGEFNRDGSRFYLAHRLSPYLAVIDTASFSIIKRIYVGTETTALKVDPRTGRIYLARSHTGQVEIFDPFSSLPIDFIRTEADVAYMTIDGEENNLVLALPEKKTVRAIRLNSKGVAAQIDVGDDPYWISLMGER
jgi:YVTN family beta-propeller protein